MTENSTKIKVCIVIGASHAGVNFAFSLRKEGWEGAIILFDKDPTLPYHRPPLSKAYLTSNDTIEKNALKSLESYEKSNITLNLGVSVNSINRSEKNIILGNGTIQAYDTLVIATGARPIIPPIKGIDTANTMYPLRTAKDVDDIRTAFNKSIDKRVVVIGGGYIGLETAASLKKMGGKVTILEREERVLARVTAPEMSHFFQRLHTQNGVDVFTNKNVTGIDTQDGVHTIRCSDDSVYEADIIIVGVGVHVNTELATQAALDIKNGIQVDTTARTNDQDIYAIGDCTFHYNPHYDQFIRLESVQNAVDQAKVAAMAICDKNPIYDAIPWFWSDQYDIKLQMVGLSTGYTDTLIRKEEGENTKFSLWYFNGDTLLAVDAVNNAKAYVLGTKFIKENKKIDKAKLVDPSVPFKPVNLLVD
ncbi:NAD(P)/FAD-dependent oxidoreductase [Aquimarina sp. RZ0]|uniref:NAD(P)/FAD-dependent oxidoreductase n=1 Tax=Aquimarina sp. RZ0 TaxID=2607730 RepID=UPI0011F36EDC|nr:FAD-dependent oxidoreductase [Aquimarina sp. RZ0]KAA1243508.1 pyridine nucleotide-disulfide oxidoreductase [Aquimarina sp. RZ0]